MTLVGAFTQRAWRRDGEARVDAALGRRLARGPVPIAELCADAELRAALGGSLSAYVRNCGRYAVERRVDGRALVEQQAPCAYAALQAVIERAVASVCAATLAPTARHVEGVLGSRSKLDRAPGARADPALRALIYAFRARDVASLRSLSSGCPFPDWLGRRHGPFRTDAAGVISPKPPAARDDALEWAVALACAELLPAGHASTVGALDANLRAALQSGAINGAPLGPHCAQLASMAAQRTFVTPLECCGRPLGEFLRLWRDRFHVDGGNFGAGAGVTQLVEDAAPAPVGRDGPRRRSRSPRRSRRRSRSRSHERRRRRSPEPRGGYDRPRGRAPEPRGYDRPPARAPEPVRPGSMVAAQFCFQCGAGEHKSWECTVRPARVHKILCRHMLEAGRCKFGAGCRFSHDSVAPHLRGTAAGRAVAVNMPGAPGRGYGPPPAPSAGWGAAPASTGGWGAAPAPASAGWGAAPAPAGGAGGRRGVPPAGAAPEGLGGRGRAHASAGVGPRRAPVRTCVDKYIRFRGPNYSPKGDALA